MQAEAQAESQPQVQSQETSQEQPQAQTIIASHAELEQALLDILRALAEKSDNKPIPIAELQTRFHNQHGQTIKQVFQSLSITLRYITFLESCRAFKLEKVEKGWLISLAKV
ncbi:MAG: hypothetical protein HC772_17750 [Leptolyngbyaceae cyanobacterium CRU_2_3]|nr:hypothetical protein [Leptolyngbyaceae cyanobacterium CRU_2_3]